MTLIMSLVFWYNDWNVSNYDSFCTPLCLLQIVIIALNASLFFKYCSVHFFNFFKKNAILLRFILSGILYAIHFRAPTYTKYFKLLRCVANLINATQSEFTTLESPQCDQIGLFIALWAIFQSLWQQWFCQNRPYF